VLDEPAASLNYGNRLRLLDHLRDLACAGTALILSTHEPDHAARLATRILSLDRVGQVRLGPADEMTTPAHLAHLYSLSISGVSP
jgi:iron complex transport system ATP-binding protein